MAESDARNIIRPTIWRSLSARLSGINRLGLLVLVGGFFMFQESRQLLTNAYRQSLETQANLIAGALAPTAQADNPFQFFEPSIMNRLLQNGGRSDWQLRDAAAIWHAPVWFPIRGFGFMRAMGGWFWTAPIWIARPASLPNRCRPCPIAIPCRA